MSTPYDRVRLVISGRITPAQAWSVGLTVKSSVDSGGPGWYTPATLLTYALACSPAVLTWGQACMSLWTADTTLTQLDVYAYLAGSDKAAAQAMVAINVGSSGNGSSILPAQTCMVVSLRTSTPGRRGRGRIYVPATGIPIVAGHLFSDTSCTNMATATKTMIQSINGEQLADAPARVVVGSTYGAYPVTACEADNDPDIQRRRSDKINATFTARIPVPA